MGVRDLPYLVIVFLTSSPFLFVLFVLYNMMGVRDLSYCRVWWLWETCHTMSFFFLRWVPFVFLNSLYWPLYFYSIVLFAISSLNIYLGLICSFDEVPLEAGFPNFCDISRQLSIYRVDSRLTELWICGLWKSCYSVCHMFVADYYMPIYLLIPYTLRLSSTVFFLSLLCFSWQ